MDVTPAPPPAVLAAFGVESPSLLSERQNIHWRVRRDSTELVLARWPYPAAEAHYQVRVLDRVRDLGWPVPNVVAGPVLEDGACWTLATLLTGAPREEETPATQRERGRRLAAFHRETASLHDVGRRPGWRDAAEILADPHLDAVFLEHQRYEPARARVLLGYLEHARNGFDAAAFAALPTVIIHGDWTPWNLLWEGDRLTGVLDLEAARRDVRIADFVLAWRGRHDEVVHGYAEEAPLTDAEWALLGPVREAHLLEGAAQLLDRGEWDNGWIEAQLERRSPLMRRG